MAIARSIDPQSVARMRAAMSALQRGNAVGARVICEQALAQGGDAAALGSLLGVIACKAGDFATGIPHFRAAHEADPADVAITANLTTALIESGATRDALDICSHDLAERDPSLRLWRLRGYLLQATEDFAAAAAAYRRVVAAYPGDFESWNNLGNALAGASDQLGSIDALTRAVALEPMSAPTRLNLATALLEAGRAEDAAAAFSAMADDFPGDPKPLIELAGTLKRLGRDEDALDALESATAITPDDVMLNVSLGNERTLAWKMAEAEAAFRRALALDPAHAEAHVLLGLLLDQTNQEAALGTLVKTARSAGLEDGPLQFIRALALRRERRFEEGLAALNNAASDVEPIRRAQLIGQFNDRLGNTAAAFAAFAEMNRLHMLDPSDPAGRAEAYRTALRADRAIVTPDWHAGWNPATAPASPASPAFLVGFPRSGTTLLDTILMGHPDVAVMEERPALTKVEEALGGLDKLAALDELSLATLRELYFAEARKYASFGPDTLLVDKHPLHPNKVPIIHRLFPDARFILVLRHPCDAALSCLMTNFRLNNAMVNFLDLETVAWVYDMSFGFWEQSCAVMPISSHRIFYENMIEDSEAELRPLLDYLGLEWRAEILDHQRTAASRGVISTASYAQVTEPIYRRAAGRWQRYREQLEPVLPVLAPWVERFGYSLR